MRLSVALEERLASPPDGGEKTQIAQEAHVDDKARRKRDLGVAREITLY